MFGLWTITNKDFYPSEKLQLFNIKKKPQHINPHWTDTLIFISSFLTHAKMKRFHNNCFLTIYYSSFQLYTKKFPFPLNNVKLSCKFHVLLGYRKVFFYSIVYDWKFVLKLIWTSLQVQILMKLIHYTRQYMILFLRNLFKMRVQIRKYFRMSEIITI